ncbi:MAG: hypothetical protein KGN02_08415 [bacterium]|nr:hypothetical protein [bacterium]
MKRRIGLQLGGALGVLACALLVACGGGGGGGSPLPNSGGGGATSTPVVTPTPTIAPTSQATSVAVTAGVAAQASFGAISNGTTTVIQSATATLPVVSAAATANLSLSAALPSGDPTPSAHNVLLKRPQTLGAAATGLAYFALSFSAAEQVTETPGFTVVFPSGQPLPPEPTNYYYLVVYDPTGGLGTGWQEVSGPATPSASSLTFTPQAVSPAISLVANTTYIFGIVSTGTPLMTPSPSPSPTPTASPTPTTSPTSSPTATPTGTGTPTPAPGTAPTLPPVTNFRGWGPSDVANAFKFPVQSGYNGQGQTVAIVGDEVPASSDVNTYLSKFGVTGAIYTGSIVTVNVDGGAIPGSDSGGLGEATLDVETVSGLAPGATVRFYAIPDLSDQSFVDAYNQVLTDSGTSPVGVMSLSFGGCEGYNGANYTTAEHPVLENLATSGIAVVASSGDQGNECYLGQPSPGPQFTPGPNYPASDDSVIGVSGTQTDTSITSTVPWNDLNGATGGGVSSLFTPPPGQIGLSGLASQTFRNVPDVTLPSVKVAVELGGSMQTFDGTSWSAPETAAMLSEIFEYCGGPLPTTFTSPQNLFYKAYGRSTSDFVDVTGGNNQYNGTSPFFTAVAGPDNVGGLGEPLGIDVANTLCANHTPSMVRASRMARTVQGYAPAVARTLNNVPRVPGLRDLGPRNPNADTRIVLVLRSNPSLPSDLQNVASQLNAAGFRVTSATGMVIDAYAPASVVSGYFRSNLHDFAQGGAGTRFSNVSAVTIPAAIAPYVQGVITNNLIVARHFTHRIH